MAKLTAVMFAIIALVLVLNNLSVSLGAALDKWTIPLAVVVIAIGKLVRNFKK